MEFLKQHCKLCQKPAGMFRREHQKCRQTRDAGWTKMTALATEAVARRDFDEVALRLQLAEISKSSYGDGELVNLALEEGWSKGVAHSMADGIITKDEENRLRQFRDRLALAEEDADPKAAAQVENAPEHRLMLDARLAALAPASATAQLDYLEQAAAQIGRFRGRAILIQAWEAAVEATLEDSVLTMDEESALMRYMDKFDLKQDEVDKNGVFTSMIKGSVLREVMNGGTPQRQNVIGGTPFNLMKSEKLIWTMDGVDYIEQVTRQERRGTSHGLSIRVMKGLYYRPSTFRSRAVEWDETGHADTGLLGFTTKHVYFAGKQKKFRIRWDKVVSIEDFSDGIGITRDVANAKPQTFVTGDGWFTYNLAAGLSQQ